jgi:predicted ATPase/class 3 adenylate cyclase/DNA-binding winged helix-turn-helix (wHTH) protein
MRYVFGPYTLDLRRYELRQAGRLVRLEPRVFDLLAYFVQHPGRTVTTEELLEQLYPHQFAPVDRLTNAVTQARKALGDTGQTQQYIQTVRRRGYRFVAPVVVQPQAETDAPSPPPDTPLPAERLGQDHTDAGSPPAAVPSALPVVPQPARDTVPTPRAAGHDRPDAERRQLTVLVCRMSGAPPRSAPLDPEVMLEVVRDYQAMGAEIAHQFAGHMAQEQGDRLVVYFGYPQAHEDDARRAVHTGLGMVAGMAELNRRLNRDEEERLAVRVGIHTGIVVVGARGQDGREQLVLGNTPTIAAQMQGLAAPNTVVISSATRRLAEGYFDCQALGTHILDDSTEPLAVYQILQERPAQSLFEVAVTKGLTPLVGREHEVGLLCERWAQVKDGLGQVVLLSGEAGIGKSRLVQALEEHLAGEVHTRVEYRCLPYYQNTALYPVVTHLQRLLRFTREEASEETLHKLEEALEPYGFTLEEMVPLLAALLSLPLPDHYPSLNLTPQDQKQKTLEALLAWLLAEAERQPVCVVMEDLHWVDASTLEWLSLLIDQVSAARLLVLLTFRPDFHSPWAIHSYLTHLTLSRLTRRQVEVMAEQVAGGKALPIEVLRQLVTKTDGVPLFVEELTKMVLESGLVKEREERYELTDPLPPLAIPATLHDSLMARLDRLETAKQVMQLGAVLGREFSYEVIRAVSPVDEATLQQELARLVEAELLYQRGLPPQARYVFKHALIQEEAYQSLLRRTRQQYHQQIAQVLEARFLETRETQPELLAHHYTEAGLSAQALPYWQQAGQRAIERSAHLEAAQHLATGLELLATLPETPARAQQELGLQMALGPALMATKGNAAPEVEQTYARARALCAQVGETPQLFSVLRGLCRFYSNRGALPTARELGEQLNRLAQRTAEPARLLEAHDALGHTLFFLGEYAAAQTHLEQGIALTDLTAQQAQALRHGAAPGVVCLAMAANTLWCLGYPAQALRRSQEALAQAQALAHPYSLALAQYWATFLYDRRREIPAALAQADALLSLATAQGFPLWVGFGTYWRGRALALQGQSEAGLAQMYQGMEAVLAMGNSVSRPLFLVLLAEAAGHAGQVEQGLCLLAEALTALEASGRGDLLAEAYRLQGEFFLRQATSEAAQAEACFQQALAIARRQQAKSWELRVAMSLSRLWQQQGKQVEACELLVLIYGWFTEGFDTADLQEARTLLEDLS